jgi:hypothetical protein
MLRYFDLNDRASKTKSIETARFAADASAKNKIKEMVKRSEELEKRVGDIEKKAEGKITPKDASGLVRDASGLVRDASGLVRDKEELTDSALRDKISAIRQVAMYFGIFLGVIFSFTVSQFREGMDFELSITAGKLLVSAIIAILIIPTVYEKLNLNPKAPFIVQFGLFVQTGVFWNVTLDLISKI